MPGGVLGHASSQRPVTRVDGKYGTHTNHVSLLRPAMFKKYPLVVFGVKTYKTLVETWCLVIAGYDPSAGAGVLADVETFAHFGLPAGAVITSVTAQDRTRVLAVHPLAGTWVREQFEVLVAQRRPACVKVGMLGSAAHVRLVARLLGDLRKVPMVLDPVFRSSSGTHLLGPEGIRVLKERLLPLASVVTPNLEEAGRLLGRRISGRSSMARAAEELCALGASAAVVTGGHRRADAVDVLFDGRKNVEISGSRLRAGRVRGTGCRYSSALAACLAKGKSVRAAAREAKRFVRKYIKA
jgi:hydroxymethylpyrimidine kinase/phosphomethylpyrimidine kinase